MRINNKNRCEERNLIMEKWTQDRGAMEKWIRDSYRLYMCMVSPLLCGMGHKMSTPWPEKMTKKQTLTDGWILKLEMSPQTQLRSHGITLL